ncbi:MAG: methionyl-tRNA formyltransferase, partial [Candidatus Omnitrophica bacterium]|nr:methionyl-tRNA formyltransferase [Candidatus Omnitrophota bacterium]
MKIVFFGSSEFSVPILECLINLGHDLLVVTTPDERKRRGQKLLPTVVKELAVSHGLECMTPARLDETPVGEKIKSFGADLFVVASYGKILPGFILSCPKLMPLNVHPSLLPKYRGAAPIAWQFLKDEKESGISFIKMEERVDSGGIVFQEKLPIEEADDAETLSQKLVGVACNKLGEVIELVERGSFTLKPQDEARVSYAPKLKKDDVLIRWEDEVRAIRNRIRAFVPWPAAFSFFKGERVKILKSAGY